MNISPSRLVGATYALIIGGMILTYLVIALFSDLSNILHRWVSWIAFSIFVM